jgi:hypothetical protein
MIFLLRIVLSMCQLPIHPHICAHKTSSAPPLFIDLPVQSQDSERSCICVLEELILPLFLRVYDSVVFLVFHFNIYIKILITNLKYNFIYVKY